MHSGRNSAEINFVLEGGLLAYSCLSIITCLGLMLLELVDVILSFLKVGGLNHSGMKEPKNESLKFSDTLYFNKVKIDGNCANGIIVSHFF